MLKLTYQRLFYWLPVLLLAASGQAAWGQQPAAEPASPPARPPGPVVVRGVVLDDSLHVPVPGVWLYLNDTKYGAITDAQGEFVLSFPAEWKPVRGGVLRIKVATAPFTFKPLSTQLNWRHHHADQPLTLRLASAPGRGRPGLHGYIWKTPPLPPPVYPPRARTNRP